ncbi:hypothetical protein AVDCRST_MAG94-4018 [uncultured Leptolyngbya sp.]|uniref:Uncharacterized protein n=1 Tax=uncultured Leptolyngbya sp. TaxID=332963 RepID=A0A6J4MUR3_9CYAN|nr:hypothetical protein AVDCRST_MAG94-4018 [uncultured Leptolyngbya sp.]
MKRVASLSCDLICLQQFSRKARISMSIFSQTKGLICSLVISKRSDADTWRWGTQIEIVS